MKKFEYLFAVKTELVVAADDYEEARAMACRKLAECGDDLELIDKVEHDPSGGDGPDD